MPDRPKWGAMQLGHPHYMELLTYSGGDFHPEWLTTQLSALVEEGRKYESAQTFYAQSQIVAYHLIGAALEGWKRCLHAQLYMRTHGMGPVTILDYGCGIGGDGLAFLDAGYRVSFADIPGHLVDFLRWRLWSRRYTAPVYTIDPSRYDEKTLRCPRATIVWCMDVLEHFVPEMQEWLLCEQLPRFGDIVFVNLLSTHTPDGLVHQAVDIEELTAQVQTYAKGQCQYYDYNVLATGEKTRLLIYQAMPACKKEEHRP